MNIKVVSPYEQAEAAPDLTAAVQQGDYLYTIQPMPERYVQKENRDQAMMAMRKKRPTTPCAW